MSNKHTYYQDYTELADDLVMYRNPDTKKGWFYCRIKIKEGGYVRRSLKTTDKVKAQRQAWTIYKDVKEKEFFGVTVKKTTLNEVVSILLKTKADLSSHRRNQYINWTKRYLLPYFDGITLDEFHKKQVYINEYPLWRYTYWERYRQEVEEGTRKDERDIVNRLGYKGLQEGENRPYVWQRDKPSRSTVLAEVRMFNAIIKFAVERNLMRKPILMSNEHLPDSKPVFAALYTFNDKEIYKIKRYFQQQTKANKHYIKDDEGNAVLDAQGNPKYILFPNATPSQRRMWINLRVAFYLQLNTGIRTQECNNLKWSNITYKVAKKEDGTEMPYLALKIEETKSKRRSNLFRTVYCPVHLTSLLNEVREVNKPHNSDDDYVFCNGMGNRYTIMNRRFKQLLIKLDLYETDIGTFRTRGHLRSYWMSKALKTKPIHVVAAAAGNSIQTCYDFYTKLAVSKRAFELLEDIRQPDSIVHLMSEEELK